MPDIVGMGSRLVYGLCALIFQWQQESIPHIGKKDDSQSVIVSLLISSGETHPHDHGQPRRQATERDAQASSGLTRAILGSYSRDDVYILYYTTSASKAIFHKSMTAVDHGTGEGP